MTDNCACRFFLCSSVDSTVRLWHTNDANASAGVLERKDGDELLRVMAIDWNVWTSSAIRSRFKMGPNLPGGGMTVAKFNVDSYCAVGINMLISNSC
jgi:hypothetical protein